MRIGVVVTCLALLLAPGSAGASGFYEGKTLTIVVGFGAGGGYDQMARVVARHLPRHLPGRPTVIVQNMPGAASVIAANHLYNVARPDGLTLGSFSLNLALAQLGEQPGVKFDLRSFGWMGSLATLAGVVVVRADLPYRTYAELQRAAQPVVFGGTGPGDTSHDYPLLLQSYLGLNLRMVAGYKSVSEVMLAIEGRELQAANGAYTTLKPLIDRGVVRPILRARASVPEIEHLPVDEDVATDATGKQILAIRSTLDLGGRPFVTPPASPPTGSRSSARRSPRWRRTPRRSPRRRRRQC